MMENSNEKVVGYVLKGYGRTSETFISNEIELLEQAGLKIRVFSMKKLSGQASHGVTQRIGVPIEYLPEVESGGSDRSGRSGGSIGMLRASWPRFSAAHLRLMRARPLDYLSTLARVIGLSLIYGRGTRRAFVREFLQAGYIAASVLENGAISHLHAHFAHTATTVTLLAASMCGRSFSFTAHAKDIYRADMNPGDLLARKIRAARFVVTCTEANLNHLSQLVKLANSSESAGKIHVIYHGVDLKLFATPRDRNPASPLQPPLLLAVGRFVEKKGFLDLIDAWRRVRDDGIAFRGLIVGGMTEYTEKVQSRIDEYRLKEMVSLEPAMTQERLKSIYDQSTIFILPSLITEDGDRDGIPNVLVEAMAIGLPVISTNISGIPELIRDGECGLLVPQRDPAALALAIERLLADPELGVRMAVKGGEFVHQRFDARRNIATLKGLFDEVLKVGGR